MAAGRPHRIVTGACGGSPVPVKTVVRFAAARQTAFDDAIDALRRQIARWTGSEVFMVLDTNFYLNSATLFGEPGFTAVFGPYLHGVRIIVPMVVVEELDRAKLGRDEFRGRAQVTLATLDRLFANPTDVAELEPKVLQPVGNGYSTPFGGATIELLFDPPGHVRMASPDSEIIDRALMVQGLAARPVTLVTYDTTCRWRRALPASRSSRCPCPSDLRRRSSSAATDVLTVTRQREYIERVRLSTRSKRCLVLHDA